MKSLINRFVLIGAALALPFSLFAGTVQTVTLDVQNMICAVCPITVKKALERVPGVRDAKVDFDKKTASVSFDPDKANPAALTKRLRMRAILPLSATESAMSEVLLESVLVCPVCGSTG